MAIMYPKSISEYMPTESERVVYYALKSQLPDSFEVFYSVNWTSYENGKLVKSEADFIVAHPNYGILCLEVKGGTRVRIEENVWYIEDSVHGERKLNSSPYNQAEKSMYYFIKTFSNQYNTKYQGLFAAGAVFPFYSIGAELNIDNRDRLCTIDCNDLNNLHDKIKKMFRLWGGASYGRRYYSANQHQAMMQLIRERIAISAAAGALVKYKEQQLGTINRVQDNYIYFLNNVRQFYIRGGAGTGKTWIAIKMANNEAREGEKTLFLCASPKLADYVRGFVDINVNVLDIVSLFKSIVDRFEEYKSPDYVGISNGIKTNLEKYDAIFIDEAQDFTVEWAVIIRKILADPLQSRLGVFYDDVPVLRGDSFGDGFAIEGQPYLLHENIRNTANIYNWVSEKTNLGTDMIANPVEGPSPITEYVNDKGQLTVRLETLFRRYLEEEYLPNTSLVLLTEDTASLLGAYPHGIAKWKLIEGIPMNSNEIRVVSVADFKGLESDMVVYIHKECSGDNVNYIAYTRAKYYLIELIRRF